MPRPRLFVLLGACAFAWLLAFAGTTLAAPVEERLDQDSEQRLTLTPARFSPIDVEPGNRYRLTLTARNATDQAIDIEPYTIALAGSSDPDVLAVPAARQSAAKRVRSWVSYPGFIGARTLEPGRMLEFEARIEVPERATPGSHAIGFALSQYVSSRGVLNDEQPASRVRLNVDLASTAVLRIPGDVRSDLRIEEASMPRVLWNGDDAVAQVLVRNTGNADLELDATTRLDTNIATATRVIRLPERERGLLILPDGRRDLQLRWTDRPWLGWYTPAVEVIGVGAGDEVRVTKTLPGVLVLPPWWVLVLLVVALVLPVWSARRRRRRRHEPRRRAPGDRVSR